MGRNKKEIFKTGRKMKHDLKSKSKYLSLILRHNPDAGHIALDNNGWALISDLVKKSGFTKDELIRIVDSDDKQRYTFDDSNTKIRANQGHSIPTVVIEFEEACPPDFLYHGTVQSAVDSIMTTGLQKQKRNYLHLSKDVETATSVGSRRGSAVILKIHALDMFNDYHKFFISKNGVYLTESVPPKYITIEY